MKILMKIMVTLESIFIYVDKTAQPMNIILSVIIFPIFGVVVVFWYVAQKVLRWRKFIIRDDGHHIANWANRHGYYAIPMESEETWISNKNVTLIYAVSDT